MTLEPAFSQRAAAVMAALADLDQVPDAAAVLAEIARHGPNPGAALAGRLRIPGAIGIAQGMPAPIDELASFAAAEAHRAGMPRTGCEHLVLDQKDGTVPCAIVLCGLPGTGKSTLADLAAARLGLPSFSFDWFLGALAPFGVVRPDNAAPLGNQMMSAALAGQLRAGRGAVLDAGGFRQAERTRWRAICESLGARFIGVECVCPDETVHRRRVESRGREIPGWPATVSWEHVGRMRARWEPWDEPHLVLNTLEPVQASVDRITVAIARNLQ